jgi:hypothetical protein
MAEDDTTPEGFVLNRMPPRTREKVQRLLAEKEERNLWAFNHRPGGPRNCPKHADLPQSGNPGVLDPFMIEDGIDPARPDDLAYLQGWYFGPIAEKRAEMLAETRANLERLERAEHEAIHAASPAFADHKTLASVHAAGPSHYHETIGGKVVTHYLDAQGRRERKAEYYADQAERAAQGVTP